jgi:dynein assembly factor 1
LDELTDLETLVLSSNYIKKIENLSRLTKLHTLELDHNVISQAENLRGLLEVPSLGVLNLSHNKLETEEFFPIVTQLQALNLFKFEGNPIARTMPQYRRRFLSAVPNLKYLDDMPATEAEVRLAKAWSVGGRDAEMAEREKIRQEKDDEKTDNRRKLRRANRQSAIERGIDISRDKSLMSSDDERLDMDLNEEIQLAESRDEPEVD